jgi:hypothetical protein
MRSMRRLMRARIPAGAVVPGRWSGRCGGMSRSEPGRTGDRLTRSCGLAPALCARSGQRLGDAAGELEEPYAPRGRSC